MLNWEIISSK